MKINKQHYEDACKLIEQEGAWIKGYSFGLNGKGADLEEIDGKPNCWCYNGALMQVVFGDHDKMLAYWIDPIILTTEKSGEFAFHAIELDKVFREMHGTTYVHYNDAYAKDNKHMADTVRAAVAKMKDDELETA